MHTLKLTPIGNSASNLDERSGIEEISAQKPRFRVTPSRLLAELSRLKTYSRKFDHQ